MCLIAWIYFVLFFYKFSFNVSGTRRCPFLSPDNSNVEKSRKGEPNLNENFRGYHNIERACKVVPMIRTNMLSLKLTVTELTVGSGG
jgi:hypothetical protein